MILSEIFNHDETLELLKQFLESKGYRVHFGTFINRACLMIDLTDSKRMRLTKIRITQKNDDTYRVSLISGQGHRLQDQVGVPDEMKVLELVDLWSKSRIWVDEEVDEETDEPPFKPASGMLFHFLKKILVDEREQIISEIPDHEGPIRLRREAGYADVSGNESTEIVVDREEAGPEGDWFEILPDDDDNLTLEKEDGVWYLRLVDGKEFKY